MSTELSFLLYRPSPFSFPEIIKSHNAAFLLCSLAKPCTTKPKLPSSSSFFYERAETHLEAAWQSSRHQRARRETSCRSCARQVSPRDRHSNRDGVIGWGNCRGERKKKNQETKGRGLLNVATETWLAGGVQSGSVCV